MKITMIKPRGTKETMTNMEMEQLEEQIRTGKYQDEVREIRNLFPLIHPKRDETGRMVSDFEFRMPLPRICFAGQLKRRRKGQALMTFKGSSPWRPTIWKATMTPSCCATRLPVCHRPYWHSWGAAVGQDNMPRGAVGRQRRSAWQQTRYGALPPYSI